ncbi:ABC transporter permease [Saccharibacillus sp. JS10]|uniref:ABC transporter permease n=1 Tax=Saccharibacillus sp. JS10 TaxID=2950552 RepID=UPI00210AFC4F|nr:ABC transporter permease [Saccharibacillus sp. JS10]MCQ4087431.1 ABC transporter permease [Saccharibacillus sp. JS10]
MKTWIAAIRSEKIKLRRSYVLGLAVIDPLLCVLIGLMSDLGTAPEAWNMLFTIMIALHALFFLPILTGIFAALVCRYEHAGGGWKQILSLPVTRNVLYTSKFVIVASLVALNQVLFFATVLGVGLIKGLDVSLIPWGDFGMKLLAGFVACLPLAALQLFVSAWWSSFAAPMVLNVIFTIPNMLVVNSEVFGPYYPWAQPMLVMMRAGGEYDFGAFGLPLETLLITIGGSSLVFILAGLTYFNRKAV